MERIMNVVDYGQYIKDLCTIYAKILEDKALADLNRDVALLYIGKAIKSLETISNCDTM